MILALFLWGLALFIGSILIGFWYTILGIVLLHLVVAIGSLRKSPSKREPEKEEAVRQNPSYGDLREEV